MKITKTEKEIKDKIDDLVNDSDNFTSDNYGSESWDNGVYEVNFSSYSSEETLKNFVKWLTS